jgi:3-hydroxyisobutyrate dehydrogenase
VVQAASASAAAGGADVVITMLPNGAILRAVAAEVIPAMRPGAVFLDCSTVDVESARAVAQLAEAAGLMAVDAPVSGGVGGAAAGTLTFMAGGTPDAFEVVRPLFHAMGSKAVHCGGSGAGQAAKICNNMILGATMIATCEAFALADKLGLDRARMFDVVSTSSGQSWSMNVYCPAPGSGPAKAPADNGYRPGFAADLMLKDLRLSQQAAEAVDADTPMGALAAELYGASSRRRTAAAWTSRPCCPASRNAEPRLMGWTGAVAELASLPDRRASGSTRWRPMDVPPGTVLFRPGEAVKGYVIVLVGPHRCPPCRAHGARNPALRRVSPGKSCIQSTLGLLGGDENYTAEAVADRETRLVLLPRATFLDLLGADPAFRSLVFAAFAERMQSMMHLLEKVAFQRVEARLAAWLLSRAEDGVVAATQADIASAIGSAREVVSRRLDALARQGAIAQTRGRVEIRDEGTLRRIADDPTL